SSRLHGRWRAGGRRITDRHQEPPAGAPARAACRSTAAGDRPFEDDDGAVAGVAVWRSAARDPAAWGRGRTDIVRHAETRRHPAALAAGVTVLARRRLHQRGRARTARGQGRAGGIAMSRVLAQARKELTQLIRDRLAMALALVLPI